MESLFDYMSRNLEEYRRMKPELTVLGEHDFPNCSKYKSIYGACCDKTWKKELENVRDVPEPKITDYDLSAPPILKKPEGFEGF